MSRVPILDGNGLIPAALIPAGASSGLALDTTATDIKAWGTRAAGVTGQAADAGHVHPRQSLGASSIGTQYKGWSMDETYGLGSNSALTGANGVQYAAIVLEQEVALSSLIMYVGVAGTVTTAGQCFAGIYDATGALLAASADISSQLTSTGSKSFAMAAPTAVLPAGAILYGAILVNGMGTAPQLGRQGMPSVMVRPLRFGVIAGSANATALPASFTPSASGAPTSQFWMAVA